MPRSPAPGARGFSVLRRKESPIKNELLEKWADAIAPWFEHERRWLGTPFFSPPEEALKVVRRRPLAEGTDAMIEAIRARHELVLSHSWAVPTDEALEAIAKHSPRGVVEIGAGTGYWAGLLRERGVDVVAYDTEPHENVQAKAEWSEVKVGNHLYVMKHPDRTLLLCWPPYATPMAAMALRRFKGDTVVYIGESAGGCNGDEDFHEMLESWEEVELVALPQWPGIRDDLYVYKR